jgi:diguanylate cyclase (GGDEF)-like protein
MLFSISVLLNLFFGYFFTISPDNMYNHGKLYILRLVLSYASILIIAVDILTSLKHFKPDNAYLIIFFLFLTGAGATLDVVFKSGSLAWPCFAAAILYIYFFIIKSDSKIDTLTGIGNRYSFNEFINRLSHQNVREDYAIVMIDLDRFKEINDTLGHLEGDNTLRDMATIIKGCIRHSDFAARYGGDEFVLAAKAEHDIQRLMNRIQDAIDLQNKKRLRPYQIYLSYGYDVFTTNAGMSIKDFFAHIDALMYRQKEALRQERESAITAKITASESEENHV